MPSHTLPDYHILKRISIITDSGILAINPGTKIVIKEHLNNGYKITFGEYEATVEESYISNDSEIVKAAKTEDNKALVENAKKMEQKKADMAEWEKRKQKDIIAANWQRTSEYEARKPKTKLVYYAPQTDEINANSAAAENEKNKKEKERKIAQKERQDIQNRKRILEKEIDILRKETKAAFDSANSQNSGVNRMDASDYAHVKQSLLNEKQFELNQLNSK